MPPKSGKAAKAATKAEVAKKQKVAEDKTFGLKNKNKSKSVQQYVKNLQSSAQAVAKQKLDPNAEKDAQRVSLMVPSVLGLWIVSVLLWFSPLLAHLRSKSFGTSWQSNQSNQRKLAELKITRW